MTQGITARQLGVFREVAEDLLTQTCTIKRPVRTPDGAGGWNTSYNTLGTAIPCRVTVRTRTWVLHGAVERANEYNTYGEYVLKLEHDQDSQELDLVEYNGEEWTIEAIWFMHEDVTLRRCKMVRSA